MARVTIFFLALTMSIIAAGCGTAPTANSSQNSNGVTSTDPKDLPPGMSTSPVPPSTNTTPGIPPANQVTNANAGTAPGIDPKNAVRTMKPGEKVPGIDPAAIKKQMNQPVDPSKLPPEFRKTAQGNANAAAPAKKP